MKNIRAALVAIAAMGFGCTAFVAANLSSTNGTVQNKVGGCFAMDDTTCGECIANNCEDPDNPTHPVSLQKVCSFSQYSSVISEAQSCATNASVDNYECTGLFVDSGTYATSIDDQQAAENNVKHCITDKCLTSCSRCAVDVPGCGSETIDLLEAGTCGNCIDQAMNQPNAPCQHWVLQSTSSCASYETSGIAQCAIPSGSCQTPDCSVLETSEGGLYACLWSQCANNGCPNP